MEFVCSEQAERLVKVGAPCPDHLVHTKRLPLWISRENATPERIAELAEEYRADYRAYFESFAGEGDVPGDPDARIVLVEGMGLVATGHDDEAVEDLARPLPPRDRGHRRRRGARRVRVPGRGRVVRDRVLAAGALQARAGAASPASCRARSRWSPAARAASAARSSTRWRPPARAWSRSTSTPTAPSDAVAEYGDRGLAVAGDVTSEDAVAGAFRAAVEAFGGVDIVVSNAGIASSASIEETTLAEWNRNHAILVTGYFLVAREAFQVLKPQDTGGSIVFIASKNALVAGKNAAAYSSAKAAELHLARCLAEEGGARRHPGQHRQPGRRPAGLEDLGLLVARGARRGLQPRPRASSTSTTASATR